MIKQFLYILLLITVFSTGLLAQGKPYDGPDDPAGDIAAERYGWMTGNRVLLFYRNTTEMSDCCGLGYDVSKWPNNYKGTKMHDGIAVLIGARVYLENDTIPVTDIDEILSRSDLDTLYYIQSSYREHMDLDPSLTIEWGLYPVFGYFNTLSETPAMSNRPESWPPLGWPENGDGFKWAGEWNGRFGRGVMKADLETFFVTNDAQDQEYLQSNQRVKYYPRGLSDRHIGYKDPNVTIQNGKPWGGVGIRIEARGFQWANPSAADAIFWEYNIANISDYDLPEMVFGFWMDNAVGGEEGIGDDLAFYTKELNMSYSWDIDFVPVGGGKEPGLLGFAYLESPGLAYDGKDNDNDGIIDEKRDNKAISLVSATYGYDDLDKFLAYYHLSESDLKEHWDADEDQDWEDGLDLNGNGTYTMLGPDSTWMVEPGEIPGDDVGLDGVGPFDLNYKGPDEGECNHKPDFIEGVGCEPNFAATDVSESDMLGLTGFRYTVGLQRTPSIIRSDKNLFLNMTEGIFDDFQKIPLNFMEFFASGIFPLYKGRTERVSMAELHSYDALAGLMAEDHAAPALFRLKEVVQVIYETDYRFAQPPLMPTLTAIPGDGKVILTWDDIADTKTRDPFVDNKNDFEGYKLYRATDKKMSDAEVITDGYGNPSLKKPIFQCDIVDRIGGFADYGAVNGAEYYLGSDIGIQHYFVDNTVQNGRTYYYVLVAYDYGLPDVGSGISPSENTFVLELDESEEVREISKNVAIVTPHQYAAGYVPPSINDMAAQNNTNGSGSIEAKVVLFDQIKPNHTYKVTFDVDTVSFLRQTPQIRHSLDMLYSNSGFSVYDLSAGNSLVYQETKDYFSGRNIISSEILGPDGSNKIPVWFFNTTGMTSGVFEGIQLNINLPVKFAEFDPENSGWLVGNAPATVLVNKSESVFFPWQYNIIFTENANEYTSLTTEKKFIRSADDEPIVSKSVLLGQSFNFYVINKTFTAADKTYEKLDLIVHDVNRDGLFEPDSDWVLAGFVKQAGAKYYWAGTVFGINFKNAWPNNMPNPGDVYQVDFKRPFIESDSLLFSVIPEKEVDDKLLQETMESITVVPNPYVMTNVMESAVSNYQLSQRRQIMFTNLPAQCTIKIFTVSGVFVDEIEVNNSMANRQTDWDLNSAANGTAKWDLKTKTGLDVAPGYYIYHVKSTRTGHEKMGKFAILK
jgi:hypothetical protein